ncbi:hypothetical protein [Oribacterium sp. WCC10]|uniref:hypothetical protein n=1 Tax=Oribacterium sp. WCC10 TaxID=1855343 RepID=UPI0008E776A0|nr:hypothetical protein [Oribacterium sp. WCC10]SFG57340.1 hypothetical protein SAMN05216356_11378 [Oribacterium sp. WCC10]
MLRFKESLQKFYTENDFWALPVIKAVIAFLCFFTVNSRVGYSDVLSHPVVCFAASVLCSFLPWTCIPVFFGMFILGNAYAASLDITIVAVAVLMLAALIQSAFRAGSSLLIALVPLFFYIHIPYVIPVIAGLTVGLMSIVPVSIGVMLYYFIEYMSTQAAYTAASSESDITAMATAYAGLFGNLFKDKEAIVVIIAFAFCIIITFIISQISFDYNCVVAVIAGILSMIISSVVGHMHFELSFSIIGMMPSLIISCLISLAYVAAFHAVDYQRTERLRFEDDDYIYFVKAIPKLKSKDEDEN